jgi:hypothetical protein
LRGFECNRDVTTAYSHFGIVVTVKVSLKGVLIGGIVDILSSSVLGVPFAVYALSKVDLAHTPKDQLGHAIAAVSLGTPWLYATQLLVGLACSVLGGYVAAWPAKHHELLNGTLSSFLCVAIGIYSIASGKDSHAHWVQMLILISAPVSGFFGGYLRVRQRSVPAVAV